MNYKSGFVSLVGRPNVGKSTLINYLLGEKITITSVKPQTTRNQIKTIYHDKDRGQIVFVDTPGIHSPRNELDNYMIQEVYQSLEGIDVIIFMFDARHSWGKGDEFIKNQLKGIDLPILPVLNKIDQIKNKELLKRHRDYSNKLEEEVIPISARTGKNVDNLITKVFEILSEGPQYYPEEMVTDRIEQFIVSEFVREKIFKFTREEVPYGTAVVVEEFKERENGKIFIRANIYVEKKSHKRIIIGKKGSLIKKIGKRARHDVERLLNEDVYLDLWVKVQKDWRDDEHLLKRMGYNN